LKKNKIFSLFLTKLSEKIRQKPLLIWGQTIV